MQAGYFVQKLQPNAELYEHCVALPLVLVASRLIVGKVLVIWWTIMAFVAIGFEHCIANMFFIPLGIFLSAFRGLPRGTGVVYRRARPNIGNPP